MLCHVGSQGCEATCRSLMLPPVLFSRWLPRSWARMLNGSCYVGEPTPHSSPRGEEQLRGNQNSNRAGLYRSQSAARVTPKADWHNQSSALSGAVCAVEPSPLSKRVPGLELLDSSVISEVRPTSENSMARTNVLPSVGER